MHEQMRLYFVCKRRRLDFYFIFGQAVVFKFSACFSGPRNIFPSYLCTFYLFCEPRLFTYLVIPFYLNGFELDYTQDSRNPVSLTLWIFVAVLEFLFHFIAVCTIERSGEQILVVCVLPVKPCMMHEMGRRCKSRSNTARCDCSPYFLFRRFLKHVQRRCSLMHIFTY